MGDRSDNFNRSDSASDPNSPSDGGANWTVGSGTWGISTNRLYTVGTSGSVSLIWTETSAANVDAEATLLNSVQIGGPIVRAADTNNYILAFITGSNMRLFKVVGGGPVQLGSTYGTAPSVGDVIRLVADDDDLISFYQNDVLRVSATDAALNTNTLCGFRGTESTGKMMWDDWSVTDLDGGGGGSSVPVFYYHQQMQSQ